MLSTLVAVLDWSKKVTIRYKNGDIFYDGFCGEAYDLFCDCHVYKINFITYNDDRFLITIDIDYNEAM